MNHDSTSPSSQSSPDHQRDQHPEWAIDHGEACREIGRLSFLAGQIVDLAEHGQGMTAEYLLTRMRELAVQARQFDSVQRTLRNG